MRYKQTVILKNNFNVVKKCFKNITLLKYLIKWQPIKLINWDGIQTGDIAHIKIWLFGWKDFKVKHEFHKEDGNILYFTDFNLSLPLGLNYWKHNHIIKNKINKVTITDDLEFKHKYKIFEFILYIPLILPIMIRKITYKTYFNKINKID